MNIEQQPWYQALKEPTIPVFLEDFYKSQHHRFYKRGITKIWSNYTPRYGRGDNIGMNWFAMQYFMKEFLFYQFNEHFFKEPWPALQLKIKEFYRCTLGQQDPNTDHLEALHAYGRMPLDIYSVPEGRFLPYGVPGCVVTNTDPRFFWLPNKLETLLSCSVWGPSTTATTAAKWRRLFSRWARRFGETDMSFIDWMGHDFSMRGMWGVEGATISGMGHLLSFSGTDTEPAIWAAKKYYGAALSCGGSVNATEHSVMQAGGVEGEFETFERLLFETCPEGIISIVSDTWNLWRVLTEYIPRLKHRLVSRPGKLVIRPDSGDPVTIMTGDPDSSFGPERAGVLQLLADTMGTDGHGHIVGAGAIYGDGITLQRGEQICERSVNLGLSPYNFVLGLGSYGYTYVTRDNHGQAMKATASMCDGRLVEMFKDPITDLAGSSKKSHRGIPLVYEGEMGELLCRDHGAPEDLDHCAYIKVMDDGHLSYEDSFDAIRSRIRTAAYWTAEEQS